jgi:ribonuclease VapC
MSASGAIWQLPNRSVSAPRPWSRAHWCCCSRLGHAGKTLLARFLQEAELEVVAFGAEHWTVAGRRRSRLREGRHRAGLNFGDCMTYAVAKLAGEPLLCLGDDIPATDLEVA